MGEHMGEFSPKAENLISAQTPAARRFRPEGSGQSRRLRFADWPDLFHEYQAG
jgi:hypothetical protein